MKLTEPNEFSTLWKRCKGWVVNEIRRIFGDSIEGETFSDSEKIRISIEEIEKQLNATRKKRVNKGGCVTVRIDGHASLNNVNAIIGLYLLAGWEKITTSTDAENITTGGWGHTHFHFYF